MRTLYAKQLVNKGDFVEDPEIEQYVKGNLTSELAGLMNKHGVVNYEQKDDFDYENMGYAVSIKAEVTVITNEEIEEINLLKSFVIDGDLTQKFLAYKEYQQREQEST